MRNQNGAAQMSAVQIIVQPNTAGIAAHNHAFAIQVVILGHGAAGDFGKGVDVGRGDAI